MLINYVSVLPFPDSLEFVLALKKHKWRKLLRRNLWVGFISLGKVQNMNTAIWVGFRLEVTQIQLVHGTSVENETFLEIHI